ncbi:hypothetical protein MMC25_007301 [Agyrium rufum]|nr:hypothetical protein [Agyrium rufum]
MANVRAATPPSTKRLMNELKTLTSEPNPVLLRLGPINDREISHWEAVMIGVKGSAYEYWNSTFVMQTGEICLDLLKTSWTPAYTLSSTLGAIHQLLTYPEADSPLNIDVANLLRSGDLVGAEGLIRWCCEEWRYDGR